MFTKCFTILRSLFRYGSLGFWFWNSRTWEFPWHWTILFKQIASRCFFPRIHESESVKIRAQSYWIEWAQPIRSVRCTLFKWCSTFSLVHYTGRHYNAQNSAKQRKTAQNTLQNWHIGILKTDLKSLGQTNFRKHPARNFWWLFLSVPVYSWFQAFSLAQNSAKQRKTTQNGAKHPSKLTYRNSENWFENLRPN